MLVYLLNIAQLAGPLASVFLTKRPLSSRCSAGAPVRWLSLCCS